jgi:hypothetical protein
MQQQKIQIMARVIAKTIELGKLIFLAFNSLTNPYAGKQAEEKTRKAAKNICSIILKTYIPKKLKVVVECSKSICL